MFSALEVEEIKSLQRLILAELNNTKKRSIFIDYQKFTNRVGLKKIFGTLEEKSGGAIMWEERVGSRLIKHTSAGDTDIFTPRFTPSEPLGIDISIDDPTKLNVYFTLLLSKETKKEPPRGPVGIIELVPIQDSEKVNVFINKDMANGITVSTHKGSWKVFREIAEEGSATTEKAKTIADYFNKNRNNPIYSNTNYDLTVILQLNGRTLTPTERIKITESSQKIVARRKNKNKTT